MDLWSGPISEYMKEANSGSLAAEMLGRFYKYHAYQPNPAEVRSWENSLTALSQVGECMGNDDVGVVLEYHLPLQEKRIDALFFGRNNDDKSNAVVIELKQWSEVSLEDEHALNVLVRGAEYLHPCEQALGYMEYLAEIHSSFVDEKIDLASCAYCHNLDASVLEDKRFEPILAQSPLYKKGDEQTFASYLDTQVGAGEGRKIQREFSGGHFKPHKKLLDVLEATIEREEEWHLLDEQRKAYNAILACINKLKKKKGRSAVLVRGGPGTGKSVIAVQILADALRLELKAAHSTGGKAFTTVLRSKFNEAGKLFTWNMSLRNAPTQSLDLLLVDEAHRIRKTSDTRWTKSAERNRKSQVQELLDASKITVFLMDENQYVRPDEIGCTELIQKTCKKFKVPLREYDLSAQFRCGGCVEYVEWIDHLLGFRAEPPKPWKHKYDFSLVKRPADFDDLLDEDTRASERNRVIAGFCWEWSNPREDGSLVSDVSIGQWTRPWNAKAAPKKLYKPENHPYTLWAETSDGRDQIGCIYSAQGFDFDRTGVIWGPDLVWRDGEWTAQPKHSHDKPVKSKSADTLRLVRNAYRVLLTRGMLETRVLCLDPETRDHIENVLEGTK